MVCKGQRAEERVFTFNVCMLRISLLAGLNEIIISKILLTVEFLIDIFF